MTTYELKRWSRQQLNETRRRLGLPPKPDVVRSVRRLAPDDPIVIACKKRAGLDKRSPEVRYPRAERR